MIRALCIGNNYLGTSAQLSGCINDAAAWAEFLEGHVPSLQARTVTGQTDTQLLSILEGVALQSCADDLDWITYSGHGTFVTDWSGDEPDGRDECIVGENLKNVRDDKIRKALRSAQGRIVVVADSCFSGSVTRAMLVERTEHPYNKRFLPPESAMEQALGLMAPTRPFLARFSNRVLLLSGSNDRQYSYESGGKGVLTTVALQEYRTGMTFAQWHAAIRTKLPSPAFEQSPQLFGGDTAFRNSPVFHT